MDLTCPKCQGAMRSYERSGVTLDQCTECRGIFLDRGELEKLVDAENAYNSAAAPAPAAAYGTPEPGRRPEQPYRDPRDDDRYRDDRGYRDDKYRDEKYRDDRSHGYGDPRYGDPRYRKKKKSFLEDFFD